MRPHSDQPRGIARVFLDPDGTGDPFVGVIVRTETGVAYGTQCAGLCTEERWVEGYLVPLSGLLMDPDEGRIDVALLRAVFHVGDRCLHDSTLDVDGLVGALRNAVGKLPFWSTSPDGTDARSALRLDDSRRTEIAEGWVPVVTSVGPGVLVWNNCD